MATDYDAEALRLERAVYGSSTPAEYNRALLAKVEVRKQQGLWAEAVAELLADERFALCGQSMVVNLDQITGVEREAVEFGSTCRPFLGEKLCRRLRGIWSTYLFSREI